MPVKVHLRVILTESAAILYSQSISVLQPANLHKTNFHLIGPSVSQKFDGAELCRAYWTCEYSYFRICMCLYPKRYRAKCRLRDHPFGSKHVARKPGLRLYSMGIFV